MDTKPQNAFENAMKALMDADPDDALFERTERGSIRYNRVAEQVRAVLHEIREPGDEILAAGCEAGLSTDALLDDTRFSCERAMWTAMIDALLENAA